LEILKFGNWKIGKLGRIKMKLHFVQLTFCLSPTANRQPSTANRQPPTVNRQPPTANRQPSTANRQPSTINPQLSIKIK